MNKEQFIKELKKLNIDISEQQLNQLSKYYELLSEWNKKINLTAIVDEEQIYLKHFYDSLTLAKICDFNDIDSLCDIGTGAGFPGLVLKIVFPHLKVVLIDSLAKRIKFLDNIINELHLENISAIHERAEIYAKSHRNEYDIVTSRAVSKLNVLCEMCLPLVKKDGYFISMKGNATEELITVTESLNVLNSKVEEIIKFNLPIENSIRTLIKIKRIGDINLRYPRNFEKIRKNPL